MSKIKVEDSTGVPSVTSPVHIKEFKPPNSQIITEGKSTTFGIGFVCDEMGKEPRDSLALSVLSYLLFDTPSSPFYVVFLESGLASGYCAGKGYDNSLKYSTFVIGFDDIEDNNSENIEKKIFETLEKVAEEGFEERTFESVIHLIESGNRIASNNFGIGLFSRLLGGINHGEHQVIESNLDVTKSVNELRELYKNGEFQKMVKKYFINNQRRVHLTLKAKKDYLEELNQVEQQKLESVKSTLTPKDIEAILKESEELKKNQESEQDIDILPTLTVKDISIAEDPTPYSIEDVDGVKVFFFDRPTNGVTHLRFKFDLNGLDSNIMQFLSIFSAFLTQLGTKKTRYDELSELIRLNIAEISFSASYGAKFDDKHAIKGHGILKISCLDSKLERALELVRELLTETDFKDTDHNLNLIRMSSSKASNSYLNNAQSYAVDFGVSSGTPAYQFYNSIMNVRISRFCAASGEC